MLKILRAIAAMTAAPLIVVGLTAPGRSQEAVGVSDQCTMLIGVVNQAASQVQAATQTATAGDEAVLLQIATIADQSTATMNEVELPDTQLQTFRDRFIAMYTDTGQAARDLVAAVQSQNQPAAQQAYEAIVSATNREPELVSEINTYCGQ